MVVEEDPLGLASGAAVVVLATLVRPGKSDFVRAVLARLPRGGDQ